MTWILHISQTYLPLSNDFMIDRIICVLVIKISINLGINHSVDSHDDDTDENDGLDYDNDDDNDDGQKNGAITSFLICTLLLTVRKEIPYLRTLKADLQLVCTGGDAIATPWNRNKTAALIIIPQESVIFQDEVYL